MNMFHYDISIPAATSEEAVGKLKAVAVIVSKLNAKELSKLAEVIANDPVKTALAKKALGV